MVIKYPFAKPITIFWLILIVVLSSCKAKQFSISLEAYVIDNNDIELISKDNQSNFSANFLNSNVLLTIKTGENTRKFCSGVLIEPETIGHPPRILTNFHCFKKDDRDYNSTEVISESCQSTRVIFGLFKLNFEPLAQRGECLEGSMRFQPFGDLAIFELTKSPAIDIRPANILGSVDTPSNVKATLVHFPSLEPGDPLEASKQYFDPESRIQVPYGQFTTNNCEVLLPFSDAEKAMDSTLLYSFRHTCDQRKGSSGSAVWDQKLETLIGLNWGGITIQKKDNEPPIIYNLGTRVAILRNFVNKLAIPELTSTSIIVNHSEDQKLQNSDSNQEKLKNVDSKCGVVDSWGNSSKTAMLYLLILPLILFLI